MKGMNILEDEVMEKIVGGISRGIYNEASGKIMPSAVLNAPGIFVAINTGNTPL